MALNASTLNIGDTHEEQVAQNLSRTQIVQYAGASGDYMPLHTDELYAREIAGYPGVFAHGMLSMGATGTMLTNWVGDGRLTQYSARFTRQVWPGDDLLAKATITNIIKENGETLAEMDVLTVNQDGQSVISGKATARIDA
ncbi:MAG: MaoC family dehydratase N-terminal domain-containing protein [Gammaproteobacteria bacterium]|nr:MaoC family dehydratase N-terminal domain-containing protein [Gammaproteobacteria bacterium]MBQ0840178.1 MaoC family dehydratase N-terminal domain-containing protein [Gammaproteobacteria bacterium]